MNIAGRMTREVERRRRLVETMLDMSETDPCGWGVRIDEGPQLFEFAVRLDPGVATGCLERHLH